MDAVDKLEWSALEYEEKERTKDWFWAIGVIVVTGGAASIIYGSYFFAILLVLSGALLVFFANKKPDTILYELNEKGLQIRTRLYPYENIHSFWVETRNKPALFIKSQRAFMPIISVPIDYTMSERIHEMFTFNNVPEEEMKDHPSEKIMDSLGF